MGKSRENCGESFQWIERGERGWRGKAGIERQGHGWERTEDENREWERDRRRETKRDRGRKVRETGRDADRERETKINRDGDGARDRVTETYRKRRKLDKVGRRGWGRDTRDTAKAGRQREGGVAYKWA